MASTSIHIGSTPAAEAPQEQEVKKPSPRVQRPKGLMDTLNDYLANFTKIKTGDKVTFFRLLATMINAGVSIVKSLDILIDQVENLHMKKILHTLVEDIEAGSSFSEALQKHPKYFSEAQVGMIEAGEASGRLNNTLLEIAKDSEKSAVLLSKIKSAMIYPVVVITIMIGAGIAVMTFVMPKIKEMFEGLGGTLPPLTQSLIDFSDYMVGTTWGIPNALLLIIYFVLFVAAFFWWKRTKMGAYMWMRFVFILPIFGKLSKKAAIARFCRSLSTLVASGIPILKALHITATSVGNALYEKRINQIADDVKHGISMAENMKDDKNFFPSMVVGMVGVAEQTAQLDAITEKLAEYYEGEVDDMVKGLSSLMEPIIIVVIGAAVATLVFAVMQPILSASDLAQ